MLGEAAITMLPPNSAKAYSPMSFARIVYLNFSDVISAEVVKLQGGGGGGGVAMLQIQQTYLTVTTPK